MNCAALSSTAGRLALGLAPLAVIACFQQLDTNADSDPSVHAYQAGSAQPSASSAAPSNASTWVLCGSPRCDNADGTVPFVQETPAIYLPDGTSTSDPCVQVEGESMAIRQKYCASCHGPNAGAGQGGMNYVLDDMALVSQKSTNATLPNQVTPGDPYGSNLYVRVANGTMPPVAAAGAPANPRPTAADLSVLYGWITACFGKNGYVSAEQKYGP